VWHAADRTLAAWRAAIAAGHVRRRPGFVYEDQLGGVQLRLTVAPILARCGDVGTVLFRGMLGLFFRVRSSWRSVFHMPRTEPSSSPDERASVAGRGLGGGAGG
jgi:hypothetical protein